MPEPIPVILCGKRAEIATSVKALLLPEYEVIHIILTPEAGVSEIPNLLDGNLPPYGETRNLGSRNYSKTAVAVITGAGYDDAAVTAMREACKGKGIWLRPDLSIPTPPLGPKYGEAVVARCKTCLEALMERNLLGGDDIYFY